MLNGPKFYKCRVTLENSVRIWPKVANTKAFLAYLVDHYDWILIEIYLDDKLIEVISFMSFTVGFGLAEWEYQKKWYSSSYDEKEL